MKITFIGGSGFVGTRQFSQNSYKRFLQDLTVEKMVESYLELYKK